jgi:hypothetical protein
MKIEMIKAFASGDAAKATIVRTSQGLAEYLTPQRGKEETWMTPMPWEKQADGAKQRAQEYAEDGWQETWKSDGNVVNEELNTHTIAKIHVDRTCELAGLFARLAPWSEAIEGASVVWEDQQLTVCLPQDDAGPCAPRLCVELHPDMPATVFVRRDAPSLGVLHWLCLQSGISGCIDTDVDLRFIELTPGMSAYAQQIKKSLGNVYETMLAGVPVSPLAHALAI